ncbi:MAG TPA: ribonuclease D [Rhizobiales bacterium]|nr:ribonuclease D [Hyphomicrobiales bacterium]
MRIITQTGELETLCDELRESAFITVDTEFMRERTYWPKLCLIQVAGETTEAIIDPLSNRISLGSFYDLMGNANILKVFHAARQDIEIFFQASQRIPHPLFDSQVAAMVCGFGDQVGYEALIKRLTGGKVDKGSRFTDWARRPLSDKQLAYALADVTHLRDAYPILRKHLKNNGREHWLAEEMAVLESASTYELKPEDAWRRLKLRNPGKRALAILIELAAWRERAAQRRDLPRRHVLKDEVLHAIAASPPMREEDLENIRGLSRGFSRSSMARGVIEAVKAGKARDLETLPSLNKARPAQPAPGAIAEMLKVVLKIICEQHGVAPKLIASAADLERIAADDNANVPALTGWRRELFGEVALAVKKGQKCLALENARPVLIDRV